MNGTDDRERKSWYRSFAEVAMDFVPGSGVARAAFEQMRVRIRRDLEEELDLLKAERERDQQTIARLSDVLERQQSALEALVEQAEARDH
ncbi:hypothetical protein HK107_05630 [Parvularcula sp. ZS-1/3]|uniref:Uncharacterized protein n=1 Tax=Parvularcula mediterranea TaxID=2732508 RepID=A0A7Y3W4I8_9PROT|nr:hypothetical protein [Parvularcula mediterranea]NNU15800.1 hypothetical protein [Parvularcula mediterranea]